MQSNDPLAPTVTRIPGFSISNADGTVLIPTGKPRAKKITVYTTSAIRTAFKNKCERLGKSQTQVGNTLIRMFLMGEIQLDD